MRGLSWIALSSIILLTSCNNKEKNEQASYSLAIVDCYGSDPLNPGPFNKYNSPAVCVLGFKVSGDNVTYYKSYGSKRFILRNKIDLIEKGRLTGIVENILSKKDRGNFGKSEIEYESRIYCGPTYVPIIENASTTKLKLVAESMPDIPDIDSMNFQWSRKEFMLNENWIELSDKQFIPFVLSSEQYANLQMPPIPTIQPKVYLEPPSLNK